HSRRLERRYGLRSLPPLAGGSRPRRRPRPERLPFLDRLAPHPAPGRETRAQSKRARLLLATHRRGARARPRAVAYALSLGPATASAGLGWLEQSRHGCRIRR